MAGFFSPQLLETIRAASDIVDVIGAYLPLKRAGANFVTLCPFHKEKSGSFNVNPHRQIFHCFGCHKGGDVFSFVKEYENITFVEAVRRLADRANIPLELDQNPAQQQTRYLKETLLLVHEQITQRWQNSLRNEAGAQIARDYLAQRGVSDEAVNLFRLGYAPEAWDDTVNWAKSKHFDLPIVEQGGLIIRKEGTDRHYDRFRGRLIFPICDEQGRVIGFSGRILNGDEKTAKYVNSPETPIFSKGKVFYGLDKSKRAILDAGFAIICEGQLDLIACYMGGVQNIVAPQGTAFTPEHARILKRYVDEVVLCFDSDTAGQTAAVRVFDSLLASGLAIRVATVPAPHDPDSLIKESGGAAFQKVIEAAEGFFDFYLNRLCATNEVTTDRGRLVIVKSMAEAVLKTGSAVLIQTYAQKTALRLAVTLKSVLTEFERTGNGPAKELSTFDEDEEALPSASTEIPLSPQEFNLLKLLLQSDEHIEWAVGHLDLDWLQNPMVREIIARRFALHSENTWEGIPAFLSEFKEPEIQHLITNVLNRSLVEHKDGVRTLQKGDLSDPLNQLTGVLLALRISFVDSQVALLGKELNHPERTYAEQKPLNEQLLKLQLLRNRLREQLRSGKVLDP